MVDEKVLAYQDTLLYTSDLQTLQEGCWLNDQVIHFGFQILENKLYKNCNLIFVDPAFGFFLQIAGEAAESEWQSAKISSSKAAFFAISDNLDPGRAYGGSHWSLLVWHVTTNSFHHFDSCQSSNLAAAQKLAQQIGKMNKSSSASFHSEPMPQQTNGYDCGVCVLVAATVVAGLVSSDDSFLDLRESLSQGVTPGKIGRYRKWLREVISLNKTRDLQSDELVLPDFLL